MTKRKTSEGTKFLRFFGPLLDALRKLGGSGTPDEVVEQIATDLNLSDEVQNELLPSGSPRYRNQFAWARFYLVRAGLLDSSKRGVWSLTERGRTTHLTVNEAGEIFSKWVKIFDAQRRAKAATGDHLRSQPRLLQQIPGRLTPDGIGRGSRTAPTPNDMLARRGCVSETNANMPTFCTNRVIARTAVVR
jgi:hypothetical protein